MGRHVEATKDGLGDEQVAESSGKEAPGEEVSVEATDQEQGTQPSQAEICEGEVGPDRPDEAPDDGRGVQVAESRFMQVSGKEVSDETPEGQEVAEPNSDQTAGMDRHVEATGDGHWVQVAESNGAEVPGRESPVEAPDWEQYTKPSCAAMCAG